MTLYYTVSDRPNYSNLPDGTLSSWPVFYVANIVVPPSLSLSDFGTFTRDGNVKQTTFRGYPLYYFFQDNKAGNTFGNKLGGVWFVVNPDNFPSKP
jgi:predicted lipoprotein with Yx(FWY)xxD motif